MSARVLRHVLWLPVPRGPNLKRSTSGFLQETRKTDTCLIVKSQEQKVTSTSRKYLAPAHQVTVLLCELWL